MIPRKILNRIRLAASKPGARLHSYSICEHRNCVWILRWRSDFERGDIWRTTSWDYFLELTTTALAIFKEARQRLKEAA